MPRRVIPTDWISEASKPWAVPISEKVVQVVQAELAEVGITCTIESMDGNSLVNDCITGNFTMADMGQNLSLDYDFLKTYFNEEYIDGLNMARYSDSNHPGSV